MSYIYQNAIVSSFVDAYGVLATAEAALLLHGYGIPHDLSTIDYGPESVGRA